MLDRTALREQRKLKKWKSQDQEGILTGKNHFGFSDPTPYKAIKNVEGTKGKGRCPIAITNAATE